MSTGDWSATGRARAACCPRRSMLLLWAGEEKSGEGYTGTKRNQGQCSGREGSEGCFPQKIV